MIDRSWGGFGDLREEEVGSIRSGRKEEEEEEARSAWERQNKSTLSLEEELVRNGTSASANCRLIPFLLGGSGTNNLEGGLTTTSGLAAGTLLLLADRAAAPARDRRAPIRRRGFLTRYNGERERRREREREGVLSRHCLSHTEWRSSVGRWLSGCSWPV